MKYYLSLLVFVFVINLSAQNNNIEKGEFSSSTSSSETLKFLISDDKKFHLSVLSGTYEEVNDSIYFKSNYADLPRFNLKFSNPNPKSDKIIIDLSEESYYQLYKVYIGTQKNVNSPIEYKSIKEMVKIEETSLESRKVSFEIDRVEFVYLVEENPKSESFIEKFQIAKDISKIDLKYSSFSINKLNFKGFYNQKTKELTVTEGRNPMVFSKDIIVDATEKPIEVTTQKNWTYDGKAIDPIYDYDAAIDNVPTVEYGNQVPEYVFKLKVENNLADALSESKKYPEKFLVIFYDTNKNAKKEFEEYITNFQTNLKYYMYDKYYPEYDNYNFYLATDKDVKSLNKLGVSENQSIVFLNSDGVKLYHAKAKINDDNFAYYNMSSIVSELKLINSFAQLDEVVLNKKKTISQFKHELVKITSSGRSTSMYSIPPPVLPAATIGEVQVVEDVKDNSVQDFAVTEVDSAATAIIDYSNYDVLKEKNNVYKLKSTQDEVNAKYKTLLDFHQNDKVVDADLVTIIINELRLSAGFSGLLFNNYTKELNANDYKAIDYILKFFNEIPMLQSEILGYQYRKDYLLESISMALGRMENKNQIDKVLNYFDKIAAISNENIWVHKNKMIFLKENKLDVEYLNAFNNYFKSYIKDDSSVIEQLDKKYNPDVDYSWLEFKNSFANELNTAAWYVVEKVKNTNLDSVSNAIKWSQTSLKIEKDNYFYLDTLAQLYYLNGQKELGILTEQKAIDAALLASDSTIIEEYKIVLEKMKNGTY
jgi:hypothetical protein